ncbi:uroporphyrinogen decarboxylase family protein [Vallitaleaceae bacterium 9-2]
MESRIRMLNVLDKKPVDRLPVTTHHVQDYFLKKYMKDISVDDFFEEVGLDPIVWIHEIKGADNTGTFIKDGVLQSENWRVTAQELPDPDYKTIRYTIHTPKKQLTMVKQCNEYTCWVGEHLVKEKSDIDVIAQYAPIEQCDVEAINKVAAQTGNKALIRGMIPSFPFYGQPGCWQDAACLFGIEPLIMETFDDPEWVHEFLKVLHHRKMTYVNSLDKAAFDILELGGGDASSTVISPTILEQFVLPYDSQIIQKAKEFNQRIAYHTCGGMMPILEQLASMKPAALETFTPVGMGGDVDLAQAKRRIGDKVAMIGGFDQGKYFMGASEQEVRSAVRKCFNEAGEGGGFILSPSDHFFDANPELIKVFADEAKKCTY